jgi:hypothetical protein
VKGLHVVKWPKKFAPLGSVDLIISFRSPITQPPYYCPVTVPVFESEMLHRREILTERIENLSCGRYLRVVVVAVDGYRKGIHLGLHAGIEIHTNTEFGELELGTVEPEGLCDVHKLEEAWNEKRVLPEETNIRKIKLGYVIYIVFINVVAWETSPL